MDRGKALAQTRALITRATHPSTSEQEARTSALIACRLIAEHGLLDAAQPSKAELTELTDQALKLWLDRLWRQRHRPSFVPVRQAVDLLAEKLPLDPFVQERLHVLVRRRASALRGKGVLLAQRGSGGFRWSPYSTRKEAA